MRWLFTIYYVTKYGNPIDQTILVYGDKPHVTRVVFGHLHGIRHITPVSIQSNKVDDEEWELLVDKGCPVWQ